MKRKILWLFLSCIMALTLVAWSCGDTTGEQEEEEEEEEEEDGDQPDPLTLAHAGRLYDKWWTEAGQDAPSGDSPIWSRQTTNTRSGTDTWRCKECHGWDYKGVEGAYGSGSHKTGFPGLLQAKQKSREDLSQQLTGDVDPDHDFSVLADVHIEHLIDFLKWGMIDESQYIDYSTKTTIGADVAHGEELYTSTCTICHGADGRALNFGSAEEPEYVKDLAVDNPWETLHKIRFGHPGSNPPMPAGVVNGWTTEDAVDVLGYSQILPE